MPRTPDPAVRAALVERAAEMLARRDPVTLRALAEAAGTSTMAFYTHFGGMPGLWRAVRQEGFTRLARRLAAVPVTGDPVGDLAALGAAYTESALQSPHLYRAMFDGAAELEDAEAAAATFGTLVAAAARAKEAGRFSPDCDPADVALRQWAAGHGLTMLVVTGVLPADVLARQAPELLVAVIVAAGDGAAAARSSVAKAWPAA